MIRITSLSSFDLTNGWDTRQIGDPNRERTMKRVLFLIIALAFSATLPAALAAQPVSGWRDAAHDRRDIRRDARDIRVDRRDLRRDVRHGNLRPAWLDRHDLRCDRRDLRHDLRDYRRDH